MAQNLPQRRYDNVNLLSEDEQSDNDGENAPPDYYDGDDDMFHDFLDIGGQDHDNPIDLTALEGIPDVDMPPDGAQPLPPPVADAETLGEAECLQTVLNVLPDIAIDHVLQLITERAGQGLITVSACEWLITCILDQGNYPRESDEVSKRKRKRNDDDEDEASEYEKAARDGSNVYSMNA
jgi:TRIAD3 protein (E3 ubiquitin-protein ligase RNF216)